MQHQNCNPIAVKGTSLRKTMKTKRKQKTHNTHEEEHGGNAISLSKVMRFSISTSEGWVLLGSVHELRSNGGQGDVFSVSNSCKEERRET